MNRRHRIAAIPGDGIGAEVIDAGLEVLQALAERDGGFTLDVTRHDWGSARYKRTGAMMPDDGLAQLRDRDAIFFGAVGDPEVPDHLTLWGLRLKICQGFDQYANIRPARVLSGVTPPLRTAGADRIDWVIVRENTEGEYAGAGGRVHQGHPGEVATEVAVFTRKGVERVMRQAFEIARRRPGQHLTCVTKSNAQRYGMVLWDEVFASVAADYPEVATDKVLVDAMTTRMVLHPDRVDTVVATNLHADILSDLAAALTGSLGVAPTANLNPEGVYPSMFEPIHGSGFDIAGQGIANPVGAFWTAALMLEHLGEREPARALMTAVEQVLASGTAFTPDLGGTTTTRAVTDRVIASIQGRNA
jgi:tartrate dehydrogenase/decarboxylase/D-malate dehydrogenase